LNSKAKYPARGKMKFYFEITFKVRKNLTKIKIDTET
jgi:hypothetical protein